ncbi:MAG: polyprenyl diphosphate synthase [Candidatus Nanoarchaeia archaeon]|nr:polyprenyl diphosphate synthase [Candidatus Nanoarchaeia archaeon]
MDEFLKRLEKIHTPVHVGIILDGNRRWAKQKGLSSSQGHLAGYESLRRLLFFIVDTKIKYTTLYSLSVENITKRSRSELESLFELITVGMEELSKEPKIKENKVKINVLGRKSMLPDKLREKIENIENSTKNNKGHVLNFCIAYDGQDEILDAVKKIIKQKIPEDEMTKEKIRENLYSPELPPVDFIIRTGMEDGARISGFMLWDSSYAEFKFRKEYWPGYTKDMFVEDIEDYAKRQRRHGK